MINQTRIFLPVCVDGYELCHPINKLDFERFNSEINGSIRALSWSPIPVEVIKRDERGILKRSDAPWLGNHAMIFRPNTIACLQSTLSGFGEFLPLFCAEELFVFNPTIVVAGLDLAASDFERFPNGNIFMVRRYRFIESIVSRLDVFKITGMRVSPTFFSERFVERWSEENLNGIKFMEVTI